MLKIAFALISLLAAAVFAGDKPTPLPPSPTERYYVVDDADYRSVDPAAFARFTPSCLHVERKRYPGDRVAVHLCYI